MQNYKPIDINKIKKQYKNFVDEKRLEILLTMEQNISNNDAKDFLFLVLENEAYEKLRIKSILILSSLKDNLIEEKLRHYYSREKNENVCLAFVEAIGKNPSEQNTSFLQKIAQLDKSSTIRSIAIKNLCEYQLSSSDAIRNFLIEIIKRESSQFPKQMALSLLPSYATVDLIDDLMPFYRREENEKMQHLILRTMHLDKNRLNLEVDLPEEPILPEIQTKIERPNLFGNLRKRKKQDKKNKKDDMLFF